MSKLTYHINLDERGMFYADVRRNEETIFEIKIDNTWGHQDCIFDDGYMKNKKDISGLQHYLFNLGIIKENEVLTLG